MFPTYPFGQLFFKYFKWHYGKGFNEFILNARSFLSFLTHFFSLKLLFKTLFSPWKRMGESYEKGFHLEKTLSTLLVNTILRVVGAVTRLVIISVGVLVIIIFVIFTFVGLVSWLFMPFIVAALFSSALFLLIAAT